MSASDIICDYVLAQVGAAYVYGATWVSMVANNSWEPGAAGVFDSIWKEVT